MGASGVWMRSRGGKGPPSTQPHKGPVCWAHDEQGTYPAIHPPRRVPFPQDFSSYFFGRRFQHADNTRKKKRRKERKTAGWREGGQEWACAWMKVIATWISVQLLFTARCPIAWLEHILIWEQETERGREGERRAGKHKKASLWQPEHWRPFTPLHILVSGGRENEDLKKTFFLIVTPTNEFHINEYMPAESNQKIVKKNLCMSPWFLLASLRINN